MPIKSLLVAGESLFNTFDPNDQETPNDSVWPSVAAPKAYPRKAHSKEHG